MLITFLLELAMLGAYGFGGYELTNNTVARWLLALLFPVIVGVLWGIFLSPRAVVTLPYAVKLAGRFLLMIGGALILWGAHLSTLATIYTVALLLSIALTLTNREIPGES
jgi:hypothetical protein